MRGATARSLARGLSLAVLAVSSATAQPEPRHLDDAALRSRYALARSRFAEIDGETVHYAAEGKGPAILLVHGSFASLRQWDDWTKKLARHYRVVRFDQSPAGLSGPSPTGDYSIEHRIRVIDGLMDKLKIKRFVMIATSSGGLPAAAYAAARPRSVQALILNNIATGPVKFDPDRLSPALRAALAEDRAHPGWHSPEYWREILLANVTDPSRITPELVQQWTDLNSRPLRDPAVGKAVAASTSFGRTPDDLRRITAPTLLLWSADDHETTLDRDGKQALELLGSTDKSLEVIENCGHMMPFDCPDRALDHILPFVKRTAAK
ncbi:alpha/beta fold hydrolase [Novosphingobium sp. AP12]|uniref:alpha/beta fold hydrolase n=1 Tax=Novosphingobium sp. AP12 TaxID=1144305 RepID=UPI0002720526|nr:alpha/beta hydrolase [Novosphingobium sp. AP12]EJL33957.1 putative hydrolase or acyltransferase of alpha/beta superfamily [Novosphingobium sp. AP12]